MYELLLGPALGQLPQSLQIVHRCPGNFRFSGQCNVQCGRSLISRLLARATFLPSAGVCSVELTIQSEGAKEIWSRRFGAHRMRSILEAKNGLLHESLGLARFVFQLSVERTQIRWTVVKVSVFGVKLPQGLFEFDIFEYDQDGHYHFNVKAGIRGIGLLVQYVGWMQ